MAAPRSALLLLLVLLFCEALPHIRCVNYIHDELLWTKLSWDQYKIDFPWQQFAKREPAIAKLLDSETWLKTSLNGPLGNIQENIDKDVKRGANAQPSRFDVSLLDEKSSRSAAAEVAQCKVCFALASALWAGLTGWVNAHHAVPSKKRIADYAKHLCEYEVPNDVLQEWVLLRAKVQPTQKSMYYLEEGQEFVMLSERQKQHATPSEIAAVRQACTQLLQEEGMSGAKVGVVHQASTLLHKYYHQLERRLGVAGDAGVPVEAVDDGPSLDPSCVDRHPQCKKWAGLGECAANPMYMVGDGKRYIGQCNRACGDCQVAQGVREASQEGEGGAAPPQSQKDPARVWSEDVASWAASLSADLLSVLHSKACAKAPPCASAAGAGMEQLLRAGAGAEGDAEGGGGGGGGKGMGGFISGPLTTKTSDAGEGLAKVDSQRMANSKVIVARDAPDSFLPHTPPKKLRPAPPSRQLPTPAAKALWKELGNQCMYITTGWWMYELCYWDSITQFHMGEDHKVDWVISLGNFQSAGWEVTNTTEAGLYPPGTAVPFISHSYFNGNDCELTGEEGASREGVRSGGKLDTEGEDPYQGDEYEDDYVDDDDDEGEEEEEGEEEGALQGLDGDDLDEEEEEEGRGGAAGGQGGVGAAARRQGAAQGSGGGGAGVGGQPEVIKRSSELRIMCSPDTELRIHVSEPKQCVYRVELYIPQLCRLEGFQVEGHELAGGGAAAAGALDA